MRLRGLDVFIDLYLVFPRNFRMVFLPHTNTVILLGTVLWYYHRAWVTCGSPLNKAQLLHQVSISKGSRDKLHLTLAEASVIPQTEESPTPSLILSLLEEYLSADQLKVTESSAVALAVFNVFLTLHPNTTGDKVVEMNSLEHQNYLTNPCFKECLFWIGRLHET